MMRLMIVDDNLEMRRLMRMFAIRSGDIVHECGTAEEAVSQFFGFHPDVVLMDVQLPGIDGIAATRVIKQHSPAVRVIVVTDFADDQTKRAAMHAGADAFLSKEDLVHLHDTIRKTP